MPRSTYRMTFMGITSFQDSIPREFREVPTSQKG